MRIRILGSAAGGAFPRWSCACPSCDGLRSGSLRARARTQTCVAVSATGESWFLLSAPPEARAQIETFPPLWPKPPHDSPIAGVLLHNGEIDTVLGLLSLRERTELHVFATAAVRRAFSELNVVARVLERHPWQTTWHDLVPSKTVPLYAHGAPSGLDLEAVPVPGKLPPHLAGIRVAVPCDNVALVIRDLARKKTLVFAPCVAARSPAVDRLLAEADCVLFDGTFWENDELAAAGVDTRTAEDLGHWPLSGPRGSLAALAEHPRARRVLLHMSDTNPILVEDGAARRELDAAGVEVAEDGMDLRL